MRLGTHGACDGGASIGGCGKHQFVIVSPGQDTGMKDLVRQMDMGSGGQQRMTGWEVQACTATTASQNMAKVAQQAIADVGSGMRYSGISNGAAEYERWALLDNRLLNDAAGTGIERERALEGDQTQQH